MKISERRAFKKILGLFKSRSRLLRKSDQNISPKGSMIVLDDDHLAYWERAKRASLDNLRQNPRVAVVYSNKAAAERGVPLRQVVKTLLVRRPDRRHLIALVRGDPLGDERQVVAVGGLGVRREPAAEGLLLGEPVLGENVQRGGHAKIMARRRTWRV